MAPHYHRLTNAELIHQADSQRHELPGLTRELANRLAALMQGTERIKALEAQLNELSLEPDEAAQVICTLWHSGVLNSGHLSQRLNGYEY